MALATRADVIHVPTVKPVSDLTTAATCGRLYLGEGWAEGLKKAHADLPHLVAQMRAPLSWMNAQLADGRVFLLGAAPAAFDAQIYHVVWSLRGAMGWRPIVLLFEFTHLGRWEENVRAIGHGTASSMPPDEAIARAKSSAPIAQSGVADHEPQGLEVGMSVTVSPDVNGGEQPVAGNLRFANAETVVIERAAEDVGTVCVHFPRSGYRVDIA